MGLCAWLFGVLWKRARPVSFGILWLFVTLAPVLNARWMSAYVFGERYLYLPSVGFCLVAGWACAALWQSSLSRQNAYADRLVAAACVVAALCVLRISLRVLDWRDDITLFTRCPRCRARRLSSARRFGRGLLDSRRVGGAEREWQETSAPGTEQRPTLRSLGALYAQQRRFDLAMPLLEKAVAPESQR